MKNRLLIFVLSTLLILGGGIPTSSALADTSHCGTISTNETWSSAGNVHRVTCDVTVTFGTTLTISQGAIVKFEIGITLYADGKLLVQGTTPAPVYFTSIRDDSIGGDTNGDGGATIPGWGDWRGIEFRDNSDDTSLIDHAIIRYAGWGNRGPVSLCMTSPTTCSVSPTISNSTLSLSYFAIRSNPRSFPTLTNNTYSGNFYNAFSVDGGTIDLNATWAITDTSYFILNDIFVGVGKTLTVQPGVIVKVQIGTTLYVDGKLLVQGTTPAPVYFTSIRDDSIGGDTNPGDGAITPGWGDWRGIEFRDNSDDTSLIDHAIIRYAGWGNRGGINLVNASPTVQKSTITNGYIGIRTQTSAPILSCNNIYDNQGYGLYNATPGTVVNAQNQWWGSITGPYHPTTNPAGTGNAVTDGVNYSPWLQAPCGATTLYRFFLPLIRR
ncbi:MAG: hypothetical protein HY868_08675 [Chloroflexi bacterium]|nr:hypothetical protein [Chloroflexota bacterium]